MNPPSTYHVQLQVPLPATANDKLQATNPAMSSPSFLPHGWVEATDPKSGRKYYANPTTRETRWDPPPRVSASAVRPQKQSSATQQSHSGSRGSSSGAATNVGQNGNPLYTASNVNEATKDPSKLIPTARAMLDKAAAFPAETNASDIELNALTPGQIADLCRIQHESVECGDNVAYTPLNPFRMARNTRIETREGGRLDVRLFVLKQKLVQSRQRESKPT